METSQLTSGMFWFLFLLKEMLANKEQLLLLKTYINLDCYKKLRCLSHGTQTNCVFALIDLKEVH